MDYWDFNEGNPPDEHNFVCEDCGEELPIEDLSINLMSGMICTGCELKPIDSYFIEEER